MVFNNFIHINIPLKKKLNIYINMIGKKLIITEEERKEIKTLYGLITEQDVTQKNPELTLDLSGTFGSGKYKLPEKADKIDDLINQIREFKKQNAGSVIEISVNSGESQVPNYDREKYPSTGNDKVDFTNEKKLPVGTIAKYRAAALKSYIEKVAPDLLKDSKLVISEPIIGGTKWNPQGGDTAKDEKFTKEQFANFKIKVIGKKSDTSEIPSSGGTDCATGLSITVSVPQHNCNIAEFFLYANNTLLTNTDGGFTANLNNNAKSSARYTRIGGNPTLPAQALNPGFGIISTKYGKNSDGDAGNTRVDTFIVTPEQSKQILSEGSGLINIWFISVTRSAHKDLPLVIIKKNNEIIYNDKPRVASGLLMTLDACGNKVIQTDKNAQIPSRVSSDAESLYKQRIEIMKSQPNIFSKILGGLFGGEKSSDDVSEKQKIAEDIDVLTTEVKEPLEKWISEFKSLKTNEEKLAKYNKSLNELNQKYAIAYPLISKNNLYRDEKGNLKNKYINSNDMQIALRQDMIDFYKVFDKFFKAGTRIQNKIVNFNTLLKRL